MAKKINIDNVIKQELGNFQEKLLEFQRYLKDNNISEIVNITDDEFTVALQEKFHKEILIQIKMQDAILVWLPLLKKLREEDKDKEVKTYGNREVGGAFKEK